MTRKTTQSLSRALGRRIAQVGVAGALVAAPVALAGTAHADTDWDRLAQCESSGNWSTDTGNGFSGGLQFTPSTWRAFGGSGDAEDASRSEQIQVAEKVKASQGMNAWPTCSEKTGQTSSAANSGSSDSDSDSSSKSSAKTEKASSKTEAPTSSTDDAEQTATTTQAVAPSSGTTHVVRSGETLSGIASRYDVAGGASSLAEKNDIANPDRIATGQQLSMS